MFLYKVFKAGIMWLISVALLTIPTTIFAALNEDNADLEPKGNNIDISESNYDSTEPSTVDETDDYNYTVPWDKYFAFLKKVSHTQLEHVKRNINQYYKLSEVEIAEVNAAFTHSALEYEQMLEYNYKLMFDNGKFNETHEFMLEFTDLSNFLLEQIIQNNLNRVNGKLLALTKWYKLLLRQKVLRQQSKIATTSVETSVCMELALCKERWFYTEYLVEWLRQLMSLDSNGLKTLFVAIPHVLDKNLHTVKTNLRFKRTVRFIAGSDYVVQRDTIDYVDEVISNQKHVVHLVPEKLKKGASLLIELFKLIDENYDINTDNEDQLEDISDLMFDWTANSSNITGIVEILEAINKNMVTNLKIWPLDSQRHVDNIWSKITLL